MVDACDVIALLPASEQRRLAHCGVVSEITKGHGSMAWQLADEDATYFLKVHLRDHRLDTLVPTLEVVRRHGISTPRIGDGDLAQQWLADAEVITAKTYVSALERCARTARQCRN